MLVVLLKNTETYCVQVSLCLFCFASFFVTVMQEFEKNWTTNGSYFRNFVYDFSKHKICFDQMFFILLVCMLNRWSCIIVLCALFTKINSNSIHLRNFF